MRGYTFLVFSALFTFAVFQPPGSVQTSEDDFVHSEIVLSVEKTVELGESEVKEEIEEAKKAYDEVLPSEPVEEE